MCESESFVAMEAGELMYEDGGVSVFSRGITAVAMQATTIRIPVRRSPIFSL